MPRRTPRAMKATTILVVVTVLLGLVAIRAEQQRAARVSALLGGDAFTSDDREPPADPGSGGFDGRFYADPETGCWSTLPPESRDPTHPPDGDGDVPPPNPLEDLEMWRAPWPRCPDVDSSVRVDPPG
jgi:hypothetical protein